MDEVLSRVLSLLPQDSSGKYARGCKKELADHLGLPHNIVAEWISGRNKSYLKYLYQIAEKYHVSVAWLKGEEEQKKAPAPKGAEADPTTQELFNLITDATPEEMAEIANYIKYIKSKRK